jgi:hypothetical protein
MCYILAIMPNKKSAKNHPKATNIQKPIIISAVVIGVLIVLWAGWWLIFKHNAYSPDKAKVKTQLQSTFDKVSFRGRVAYSNLTDEGCDDRNSVGLATYIHCSFLAQKYFVDSGNLPDDLRKADKALIADGWQRSSIARAEDYDTVFSGASREQLGYSKTGQQITLVFYKDGSWTSMDDVRDLSDAGKIPLPNNEFIYGVRGGATYWSCRSDSLFKICPLPPSSPKP